MIRDIVTDVDALREISTPVNPKAFHVLKITKDLADTMRAHDGVGLSAIQIGIPLRICVIREHSAGIIFSLVNPKIYGYSDEFDFEEEGCLSLPGVRVKLARPIKIEVADGRKLEQHMEVEGLAARIIQHEIDHMDGKLIIDYAPRA